MNDAEMCRAHAAGTGIAIRHFPDPVSPFMRWQCGCKVVEKGAEGTVESIERFELLAYAATADQLIAKINNRAV